MKITKTQLRNIVQEELTGLLKEAMTLNELMPGAPADDSWRDFQGSGGYDYTLLDSGDYIWYGPGGTTGIARTGSPEHASIAAEDTTGQSHYQAPAPAFESPYAGADQTAAWAQSDPNPLMAGPGPEAYYGQAQSPTATDMYYNQLARPNRAAAPGPALATLPGPVGTSTAPTGAPFRAPAQWAQARGGAGGEAYYAAAAPDTPEYFKKGELRKLARQTRAAEGKPAGLGHAGRQALRQTFADAPRSPDAPRQRDIELDDLERIRTARDK